MGKQITFRDAQRWQRKQVPHEKPEKLYNKPIRLIGEYAPAIWRLETLAPGSSQKETREKAPEQIKALVAAITLQLADYCNAKGFNLGSLVEAAVERIDTIDATKGGRVQG